MARVVYGHHPVESALRRPGAQVRGLLVADRRRVEPLVNLAERMDVPVQHATEQDLDAICGGASHQGVVAILGEFPYRSLHELLTPGGQGPLLVCLDSVTDPQNLGAIFRSALVLGATGLVLPRDRAAGVTPVVVRVSAGATEHLPCARVTNLARALDELKEAGIWVAGAVEQGGQDPAALDLAGPLCLVLGSEHSGIRPLVRKRCDLLLTLPAAPGSPIAALNVSAAATALCYEVSRQRRIRAAT